MFLDAVAEHIGVQRYECRRKSDAFFSALAAFQEPGAHYTVEVRGEALEEVFVRGASKRAAWRTLAKRVGCRSLARSTVTRWCRSFARRAGHLAGVLAAQVAPSRVTSVPAGLLRSARAAFRLHRRWPRFRFWEWFHALVWNATRRPILSCARRDRRPHVWVIRFEPANRLRSPP